MLLTSFALACGLVLGLVRRGSLRSLRTVSVRWWPVVIIGIALQATEQLESLPGQAVWYTVGLVVLVAATMANVHLKGAAISGLGLSLNLMVMLFNQYIPLRWDALTAVRSDLAGVDPSSVSINGLWQAETASTRLAFLGDIIPVSATGDVVSFGDLILLAGLVVLAMNLLLQGAAEELDDVFFDDSPVSGAPAVPVVLDLTETIDLTGGPLPDTPQVSSGVFGEAHAR